MKILAVALLSSFLLSCGPSTSPSARFVSGVLKNVVISQEDTYTLIVVLYFADGRVARLRVGYREELQFSLNVPITVFYESDLKIVSVHLDAPVEK